MILFENQPIGRCVCVDWDLYFKDFEAFGIPAAIAMIRDLPHCAHLKEKISLQEIEAFYQSSASGNVHLAIRFPCNLSVLDGFMIRAFLADDQQRLRLDLARYAKTGSLHEMNRCFQSKITVSRGQATLSNAGPWIRLDLDLGRGHFTDVPSARDGRKRICKMQDECLKRKREEKKKQVDP